MAGFGFRPVRYLNGAMWNGATVRCSVLSTYATAVFPGDSVILAGTSTTSPVDGAILNDVQACAATNRTYGVVTSVIPTGAFTAAAGTSTLDLAKIYRPLSTYGEVMVAIVEPGLVFETTINSAVVVSGATAVQGTMYQLLATAGSTTTGLSGHTLSSTASTTNEAWMVVGVRNDPANLSGLTSGTTAVINTATSPTVIEVVCTQPQMFPTQVGAGV
jgi:hypothetical protein